jgi:hypothetical protein
LKLISYHWHYGIHIDIVSSVCHVPWHYGIHNDIVSSVCVMYLDIMEFKLI